MKYHVECEVLSLNANSPELPTLEAPIFETPQVAVDHARQWVANFNGAAVGLPRARVAEAESYLRALDGCSGRTTKLEGGKWGVSFRRIDASDDWSARHTPKRDAEGRNL